MGKAQEIIKREEERLVRRERQVLVELRSALRAKFVTPTRVQQILNRVDLELEDKVDMKLTPKVLDIIFRESGKDDQSGPDGGAKHLHIHNLPEEELRKFVNTGILSVTPKQMAQKVLSAKPIPEKPKEKPPPATKDPSLVY